MLRAVTTTPGHDRPNPPVFSAGSRWGGTVAAVVGGLVMVALTADVPAGTEPTDGFVLPHGLVAAPYLLLGVACTWRALALGPPEYRPFWRRWLIGSILGMLAALAAIASVATHTPALLHLDMALLVAALPFWLSAAVSMARAQAGRRSISVDVVDALSALLVLGAPAVLLVAGPLGESEKLAYAVPFAVIAVFAPALTYISLVNLPRVPRGERAAQGLGAALAVTAGVNLTLQQARVLGGLDASLRTFVAVHVATMALLGLVPLWSHRRPTRRELADHTQVRHVRPMPYVSAVVLPPVALFVFATRDRDPWSVWFLTAVTLAVVLLNALRYTAMSRETRRLHAGLTRMAEERRLLLARMRRGLETDHHRTATELHSQAVGSLATLRTLVQMAHVALPGDTALTVKETIATLQADLSDRAEHLRQLMLAIRPPILDPGHDPPGCDSPGHDSPGNDDALAAALAASTSELDPEGSSPTVGVEIDPGLQFDWATMTIVYRIAQEAVVTAARYAGATTIGVAIRAHDGQVLVEVRDDGIAVDRRGPGGARLDAMRRLAELGGGTLTVTSTPGEGTVVRGNLGPPRHDARAAGDIPTGPTTATLPAGTATGPPTAGPAHRHLRMVTTSHDPAAD